MEDSEKVKGEKRSLKSAQFWPSTRKAIILTAGIHRSISRIEI